MVLVNGLETWVQLKSGAIPLSTQHYGPDVTYPRGVDHLAAFAQEPWPQWTFRFPDGTTIVHEIVVAHGDGAAVVTWRRTAGDGPAILTVRPLLSGRDYHALMHENGAFDFTARTQGGNAAWKPYRTPAGSRRVVLGRYTHEPTWYRNFLYTEEASRGLDCVEDLASPGTFAFDLALGEAALVLRTGDAIAADARGAGGAHPRCGKGKARDTLAARPRRRRLPRAPRRGPHDHRGLPVVHRLGTRHLHRDARPSARRAAASTSRRRSSPIGRAHVSEGMLPNRFPDGGEAPEYNAVDASLWFVVVAHELIAAEAPARTARPRAARRAAILDGYTRGTRYGIRMDADGLLACGEPGLQLTWMDAKVGDRVITPRIGKPVEVQALWINALRLAGGRYAAQARPRAKRRSAHASGTRPAAACTTWSTSITCAGRVDASVRPNQIFAVGGLPFAVIDGDAHAPVVETVERELLTPTGSALTRARRSRLSRRATKAASRDRDGAYHQGTVWPWLIGAFVDAWLRVHGDDAAQRAEARDRFLAPLEAHLHNAGLGPLCRDRRRRSAAHAARLPVPGVVAGGAAARAGGNELADQANPGRHQLACANDESRVGPSG